MEKMPSSIFNDVIGPVMRGPSISHVAAAARIGRLIHMSAENQVQQVIVDFDPNGSLAESYHGHGSDIGLVSGLLGMELTDPRVGISLDVAKQENVDVQFNIIDYGAVHPNNYRMKVTSGTGKTHLWEAISVGGGMIEMQKLVVLISMSAAIFMSCWYSPPVRVLTLSKPRLANCPGWSIFWIPLKTTAHW